MAGPGILNQDFEQLLKLAVMTNGFYYIIPKIDINKLGTTQFVTGVGT
jgi:hypothetical protein